MKLIELFEDTNLEPLPSIQKVKSLIPQLAKAAQKVYDDWAQDEEGYDEELGEGGICQDIADSMAYIMSENDIDSYVVDSGGVGEQHVWIIVKVAEGVYSVDIPPGVYETGSGFRWRKIRDAQIQPSDVELYRIDSDPETFDQYVEQ